MTNKFNTKPGTAKIQYVAAQLSAPTNSNPQGVTIEGWFTVIGGELSLTDRSGLALRDGRAKLYIHQLHKMRTPGALRKGCSGNSI